MDCTKAEDAETTPAGHCPSRWAERPALSGPVMDGVAAALYAKRLLMYDTGADSEQASSGIALVLNDEYNENLFAVVKRTPAWNRGGVEAELKGERRERGGWVEFGSVLLGCGRRFRDHVDVDRSPPAQGEGRRQEAEAAWEEEGRVLRGGREGRGQAEAEEGREEVPRRARGEAGRWGGCGGDGGGGGGGGEGGAAARAGQGERGSWRGWLLKWWCSSRPDQARSVGQKSHCYRTIKLQMSAQQ